MEGFVKLHRKTLKWEWGDDPNTFSVFVHLLLMANHEPCQWHGITIERGQVLTSLAKLSKLCGITIRNVRTCISRLISTKEITQITTSKYRLITICKYDTYQSNPTDERHNNRHKYRQSTDNQATTNKNIENEKKNKYSYLLEEMTEEELTFHNGMKEKYPSVMAMENPLTLGQYKKLTETYSTELITEKLQAMENKRKDIRGNSSAYLTCLDWCRRDFKNKK